MSKATKNTNGNTNDNNKKNDQGAGKKPAQKKSLVEMFIGTAQEREAAAKKKKEQAEKRAIQRKNADEKKRAAKQPQKSENTQQRGIRFLGGLLFSKMAKGGAQELSNNAEEVNKLNVFPVPDGDTGDNMKMTIESGVAAIENLDTDNLAEVMQELSHGMLLGARGNSGVILSQFFAGMAKGLDGVEQANPQTLGHALEIGVEQAYASVMTPTEGTILTVARESVEFAVRKLHRNSTIKTFFRDLVDEMQASLDRTPEILAVLKEADVVDSGGAGLLYIMDGFNRVLNGKIIDDGAEVSDEAKKKVNVAKTSFGPDSEMTYGYCTELLLQLQNSKCNPAKYSIAPLKKFLASIGDSIVAFKTDSIVKIHVHTFTPEKVLEYCRSVGEFLTVKIENMSVQHTESADEKGAADESEDIAEEKDETVLIEVKPRSEEKKKHAVVTVCNGEGMISIFSELGADVIIVGGQAHNPSTNDFLDAFAKINAENIFVFPNNGNIMMAASQAAELHSDANVVVIPSKIVCAGYIAMATVDLDGREADEVRDRMIETIQRVATGYVSPSVRDADIGGINIKNGDTIGIIGKDIVVSDASRITAVCALADRLLEGDRFMLTVFTGEDAAEDECNAIKEQIEREHPDIELYFVKGDQQIYPYLFIAE